MDQSTFDFSATPAAPNTALIDRQVRQAYYTPQWVAEALVDRHFPDLRSTDCVIEPTCGEGPFLAAIPAHVPAFGVEINEVAAARARAVTGREVIVGDVCRVEPPMQVTAAIGNPPFRREQLDPILDRLHQLLPEGGRAGLLLAAYAFQSSSRVVALSERWSINAEMLPRDMFPRLSLPIVFAMFRKDRRRTLVGFALYEELDAVRAMPKRFQDALSKASKSAWGTALLQALADLGGEASLEQIYERVAPRRPTANPHWRDRLRAEAQQRLVRTARGRYAMPMAA